MKKDKVSRKNQHITGNISPSFQYPSRDKPVEAALSSVITQHDTPLTSEAQISDIKT